MLWEAVICKQDICFIYSVHMACTTNKPTNLHLLDRHILATVNTQLRSHGAVSLLVSGESLLLDVLPTHLALDFGEITATHMCLEIEPRRNFREMSQRRWEIHVHSTLAMKHAQYS